MIRVLLVVGVVWLALMPPLFTDGACQAEYEEAAALVKETSGLATPDAAMKYFQQLSVPASALTPEACARAKPRELMQCPSGTLVMAEVPVRNTVCRIYRDSGTELRLQYDRKGHLARVLSEMKPYKYLDLPWGGRVNWAR